MKPSEALAAIKALRDKINQEPDPTEWTNPTIEALDNAADTIEFPTDHMRIRLHRAENVK